MQRSLNKIPVLFFVCCLGFIPKKTQAQHPNDVQKQLILEQRIEFLSESMESENLDLNTVLDKLSYYYDHPLNLNRASAEELEELFLLNDIQINDLLRHIERYGRLISIYELQTLNSWSPALIQQVIPFVFVSDKLDAPHVSFMKALKDGSNDLFMRWGKVLEMQEGYRPVPDSVIAQSPNSHYVGGRDKLYTRYRFRAGNYASVGLTAEKDAGEQFFNGAQKNGFDYYSGHIFLRNLGVVNQLAVGDYQVVFGQGLVLSSGLAFGKTSNTINIKRYPLGFKPYTSVAENNFLRGGAVKLVVKKLEFCAMYSQKKVDANSIIDSTITDDGIVISSLQTSGLHNTPGTIEDKDAFTQRIMGGNLAYQSRRLRIAATAAAVEYSGHIQETNNYYNMYDFSGTKNFVAGMDYNWVYRNINIFGEVARSQNNGWAQLHGAIISLDQRMALSVLYRNYSPQFQYILANAFAEASTPVNEQGLYAGLEINPNTHWTINLYADGFKSEWLRYQVNAPSHGFEYLAQATWKPNKQVQIYMRARHRQKQTNTDVDVDDIEYLVPVEQTNIRIHGQYKISPSVTLRNRAEAIRYHQHEEPEERGYMIYQDVIYKPMLSPLSFSLRYALFSTDSYNARIYAYENDVLYYYSVPAYYYRGSRMYATIRYQYRKMLDVWFRIGGFLYENKNTVGSGNDMINTNHKTEVRLQVILHF